MRPAFPFLLLAIAHVAWANSPPVFPVIPDAFVFEGTTAAVDAAATDPDGDPLFYSATGPAWLSIDPGTGQCVLKPGYAAAAGGGLYPVTIQADDGQSVGSTGFTIHALDSPTAANLPDAVFPPSAFQRFARAHAFRPYIAAATLDQLFDQVSGLDVTFHVRATGELTYDPDRPDLALGGPMPLRLARHYASIRAMDGGGTGWTWDFDWRLSIEGTTATVTSPRGRDYVFENAGAGVWNRVRPNDAPYQFREGPYTFGCPGVVLGEVVDVKTVEGEVVAVRFDPGTLHPTLIEDTRGNSLALTWSGNLLVQVADGLGRALTFTYDAQDRLTGASDGTRSVSYGYDVTTGALASFTDALGQTTLYAYAAAPAPGLLASVTFPSGNTPFVVSYDPLQGRVLSVTDAFGATHAFGSVTRPSPLGIVATTQDPGGGSSQEERDDRLQLARRVDPAGGSTSFTYDASGRMQSLQRPAGDLVQVLHDPASGRPSSLLLPDGTATTFTYVPRVFDGLTFHDPFVTSYPDGSTTQWSYDGAGHPSAFQDRAGQTWTFAHDPRGQVTQASIPGGGTWQYGYDGGERMTSATDPSGNVATYEYDAVDRLTRIVHPDLSDCEYAYDALDRPLTRTDERNAVWTFQWTPNGRLEKLRDPLLHDTQVAYDAMDRPTTWTDAVGGTGLFGYDAAGRLSSITDRTSRMTQLGYDAMDRLVSRLDPASNLTQYQYDANSRLVRVTNPLGHARQVLWDGLDRPAQRTDATSAVTQWVYDPVARTQAIAPPSPADPVLVTFDPRGRVTRVDYGPPGPPHATKLFTYKPWGALQSYQDPNGGLWSFGYDAQGRRTSTTDPLSRTTTFTYDTRSRPSQAAMPVGSVSFGFDVASRLTSRALSGGPILTYSYDDANRLTGGTGIALTRDALGRITSSQGVTYAYDAEGRLTGLTVGPGRTLTYTYDARGLPETVQDWVGGITQVTHDAAGRRALLQRPNGTHAEYQYDAEDRLLRISDARADTIVSITVGRDARGLVVSAARKMPHPLMPAPGSSAFTYDAAGQVSGYAYDGDGRLLLGGGRSYAWDAGSRLLQLNQASGPVTYGYDALDRMTARADASGPRTLVRNELMGGILVERQGASDARYTVQLPDPRKYEFYDYPGAYMAVSLPIDTDKNGFDEYLLYTIDATNGSRSFLHPDEAGNVLALSNNAGNVEASYRYDAYGHSSALGLTGTNPYTFGGAHGVYQEGPDFYRTQGWAQDAVTARSVSPPALSYTPRGGGWGDWDIWMASCRGGGEGGWDVWVAEPTKATIAQGQTSPETVWIAWFTSPGHSRNMAGDWLFTKARAEEGDFDWARFEVSREWIEMFGDIPHYSAGRWCHPYGPPMDAVAPAAGTAEYDGLGRVTQVSEPLQTTTYSYDPNGNLLARMTVLAVSAVGSEPVAPLAFTIGKVAPNPVRFSSVMGFMIPARGRVQLHLFDVAGREVARPVDEVMDAGPRKVTLSPSGLAAGVYFFRLDWGGRTLTRRFSVVH